MIPKEGRERLAPLQATALSVTPARCLHARYRFSTCDVCVRGCPADALKVAPPIELDLQACIGCGLCLHLCPVGAFNGNDGSTDLLTTASRLKGMRTIELACALHKHAETGPASSEAVLRTNGCLASLGPSAYASLAALGFTHILARLDACAECPVGMLQPHIMQALSEARRVLPEEQDGQPALDALTEAVKGAIPRPVYDTLHPPLSRRDFFRVFRAEAPRLAVWMLRPEEGQIVGDKSAPRERRQLVNALRNTPLPAGASADAPLPSGLGLVKLAVDDNCSACGICARLCPTAAFQFATNEDNTYRLAYSPAACTDCGACLELCEPKALSRAGTPSLRELIRPEPVELSSGPLRVCQKCGIKFASHANPPADICSICDFRIKNPFGSRLPPGFVPRKKAAPETIPTNDANRVNS